MLRTVSVGVAAMLAMAGFTTAASAAVLECTFENGGIEVYKIAAGSWQVWDGKAWAWQERSRNRPAGFNSRGSLPPCSVTVDNDYYKWMQNGDGGYPEIDATISYQSSLTIDRQSGALKSSWSLHNVWATLGKVVDRDGAANGMCKPTTDPSLKPKPAPKL